MNIDDDKLDLLREVAHIGAGNASKSLSEITNKRIEVGFPSVDKYEADEITGIIGDKKDTYTSVTIDLYSEISDQEDSLGRLTLLIKPESARRLAAVMNQQEEEHETLSEMDISALKEAGNILAGQALGATSDMLDANVVESVPYIQTDMLGSIMDGMVLDMVEENDDLIVFRTKFEAEDEIEAYFIVIFNERGYNLILDEIQSQVEI
jgi:chemotaxis protein CheC